MKKREIKLIEEMSREYYNAVELVDRVGREIDKLSELAASNKKTAMALAVGNEELGKFIGVNAICPNCKKYHKVKYGDKVNKDGTLSPSKLLGYVKCNNGEAYLVAIDGREYKV